MENIIKIIVMMFFMMAMVFVVYSLFYGNWGNSFIHNMPIRKVVNQTTN